MKPRADEVDRFVMLVDHQQKNTWIHLHCRGGKGRSTTFFAMYDMLKNAGTVSFDDIIQRQAAVTPHYDLSRIPQKYPELIPYYQARLTFLKQFYQFAQEKLQGYPGTWSTWIAT